MGIIFRYIPSLFWIVFFFNLIIITLVKEFYYFYLYPIVLMGIFYGIWIYKKKKELSETAGSEKVKYTISRAVFIILLTVLFVWTYEIALPYFVYKDMSANRVFTLQKPLIDLIDGIKEEFTLNCFYSPDDVNGSILKNYLSLIKRQNRNIKFSFEDFQYSAKAKTEKIIRNRRVLIEYKGRKILFRDFEENRVQKYLYSSIKKILDNKIPKIAWVKGHGEKEFTTEKSNCKQLEALLNNEGFYTHYISLTSKIPEFFDCVVIAGALKEVTSEELNVLNNYLKKGGNLLLMLEPEPAFGFKKFLSEWNFNIQDDILVDGKGTLMGGGPFAVVAGNYGIHPSVTGFKLETLFNTVRSVYYNRNLENKEFMGENNKKYYYDFRFLVRSTGGCFAIPWDGKDQEIKKKPLISNVVQLASSLRFEREDGKDTKIIVVGDSDFITDRMIAFSGNRDFLISLFNWLTDSEPVNNMNDDFTANTRFILSQNDYVLLKFFTLGFWPCIFLGIGISQYIRLKRTEERDDNS